MRPLFETVDEREFTNRQRELTFLNELVVRAKEQRASSHTILARKGMGKTALLERFYNDLFSGQREVIPFYISFGEFKGPRRTSLTIRRFMEYYLNTLVTQYVAFYLSNGALIQEQPDLAELFVILGQNLAAIPQAELLRRYITHALTMTADNYHAYLPDVVQFTRRVLGNADRTPGILLIDEFQVLTELRDEESGEQDDITELFQKTAEARWCPMIVTGSAVSLITRTTMGGLLARRFGVYSLLPFDPQHTLEYATKLAEINHIPLAEGIAYTFHTLTGGNPYYIWCLLNSYSLTAAGIPSLDYLYTVYSYELNDTNGKLRNFWDVHFSAIATHLNAQGDALRLLYHLATHEKDELNLQDAANYLKRSATDVEKILSDLEQADLVERRLGGLYRRIIDPILADYIVQRYRTVLESGSLATYLASFKADFQQKMGSLNRSLRPLLKDD